MRGASGTPLLVVVGDGGVGKTTLAAALGVASSRGGDDTLVMTFDPSHRLKDALRVGDEARDHEVTVAAGGSATLAVSLLDAGRTFDRLVLRHSPTERAARRILDNPFYRHLSAELSGILEYMAVERLFEVASEGRYARIILDTPPTRQAMDFLGAAERLTRFLDGGALDVALQPWFDEAGHLRATSKLGFVGRGIEHVVDRFVGLDLLREVAEFFQAFAPLYDGFRKRAGEVQGLMHASSTVFVLVARPGEEHVPATANFARALIDGGFHLGPIVVNSVHPEFVLASSRDARPFDDALAILSWLGEHDRAGLERMRQVFDRDQAIIAFPLLPEEPSRPDALGEIGEMLGARWKGFAKLGARESPAV